MRPLLFGLFALTAVLLAAPGEARAVAVADEPNRIICGLHAAEERALLASAVADDPAVSGAIAPPLLCPLGPSGRKKCPQEKGAMELSDCCCVKRGGADAATTNLQDHLGGVATLPETVIGAPRRTPSARPTVERLSPSPFDAIPSPPPERPLPF